jgi:hypothetical protein
MEGHLTVVDPLEAAILTRLSEVTGHWQAYNRDAMSETEEQATFRLIACGFFRVEIVATVQNCDTGELLDISADGTGSLSNDDVNRFIWHYCPWVTANGVFTRKVEMKWDFSRVRRTPDGERAAAMVASGTPALVLRLALQGPHLPPELRLLKRISESTTVANNIAAAQATARTGDISQTVSQPITVNNYITLPPSADGGSSGTVPKGGPPGVLTLPESLGKLKRCQHQAYEAYKIAVKDLSDRGVTPDADRVWQYVRDVEISLSDGTRYTPPETRRTFEGYYNRVLNAMAKASSE